MHDSELVRREIRTRFADTDSRDIERLFEAIDLGDGSTAKDMTACSSPS
jgi:hypothetical protein